MIYNIAPDRESMYAFINSTLEAAETGIRPGDERKIIRYSVATANLPGLVLSQQIL